MNLSLSVARPSRPWSGEKLWNNSDGTGFAQRVARTPVLGVRGSSLGIALVALTPRGEVSILVYLPHADPASRGQRYFRNSRRPHRRRAAPRLLSFWGL